MFKMPKKRIWKRSHIERYVLSRIASLAERTVVVANDSCDFCYIGFFFLNVGCYTFYKKYFKFIYIQVMFVVFPF